MTKNPFLNALAASGYITAIALILNVGMQYAPKEDSFLAPVAMISLFTLSAAVMGYLFCYTPLMLYVDGKKKASVTLFLQTVGSFAVLTAIAFVLVFTGAFR